ncbi:hypothetical protein M8818_000216 [Zalaria obscura]|uniref:Uncharacterized protein n=1 Tax=Zalaria obscura TaxID=2024903 RepID=A0ACC3SNZ7_9PEZI
MAARQSAMIEKTRRPMEAILLIFRYRIYTAPLLEHDGLGTLAPSLLPLLRRIPKPHLCCLSLYYKSHLRSSAQACSITNLTPADGPAAPVPGQPTSARHELQSRPQHERNVRTGWL